MAIKKYTSGAWVPAGRKYGTETDTITSLPAQIIGDGQPITSCQISGNMVQNGTPTPEAPVDVVGCGERTANLFDKVFASGYHLSSDGRPTAYTNDSRCATLEPIDVSDLSAVTFSFTNAIQNDVKKYMYSLFDGSTLVDRVSNRYSGSTIDVSQGNKLYLCVYSGLASVNAVETTTDIMLNLGSTALHYEPYGWKIPLTCAGQAVPVYLGQVPTTRRIKKIVLTGDEGWTITSNGVLRIGLSDQLRPSTPLCTHYLGSNSTAWSNVPDKSVTVSISGYLALLDTAYTTAADFKSYLSAQYQNGTPVTVWYVLATPETGIVNEPLMKIGDYADTVSVTSIPTTGTPENFDVGTTLKPSEVQLTYHGWHEHADTKYTE